MRLIVSVRSGLEVEEDSIKAPLGMHDGRQNQNSQFQTHTTLAKIKWQNYRNSRNNNGDLSHIPIMNNRTQLPGPWEKAIFIRSKLCANLEINDQTTNAMFLRIKSQFINTIQWNQGLYFQWLQRTYILC